MAKETDLFEIVRKLRYMQVLMEGTFLATDNYKFKVQHTHQNIIECDSEHELEEPEEEEEEEEEQEEKPEETALDKILNHQIVSKKKINIEEVGLNFGVGGGEKPEGSEEGEEEEEEDSYYDNYYRRNNGKSQYKGRHHGPTPGYERERERGRKNTKGRRKERSFYDSEDYDYHDRYN